MNIRPISGTTLPCTAMEGNQTASSLSPSGMQTAVADAESTHIYNALQHLLPIQIDFVLVEFDVHG